MAGKRDPRYLHFWRLLRERAATPDGSPECTFAFRGDPTRRVKARISDEGPEILIDPALREAFDGIDHEAILSRLSHPKARSTYSQCRASFARSEVTTLNTLATVIHGPLTTSDRQGYSYNVYVEYEMETTALAPLLGDAWSARVRKGGVSIQQAVNAATEVGLLEAFNPEGTEASEPNGRSPGDLQPSRWTRILDDCQARAEVWNGQVTVLVNSVGGGTVRREGVPCLLQG